MKGNTKDMYSRNASLSFTIKCLTYIFQSHSNMLSLLFTFSFGCCCFCWWCCCCVCRDQIHWAILACNSIIMQSENWRRLARKMMGNRDILICATLQISSAQRCYVMRSSAIREHAVPPNAVTWTPILSLPVWLAVRVAMIHVLAIWSWVWEFFQAFRALKWLFAGMQTLMFGQMMLVLESLRAILTFIWTLACSCTNEKRKWKGNNDMIRWFCSTFELCVHNQTIGVQQTNKKTAKNLVKNLPECSYLCLCNELCLLKALSHWSQTNWPSPSGTDCFT